MPRTHRSGGQTVTDSTARDITQIQAEKVYLGAGEVVRSAYLEQVKRIAPVQLNDRDQELAELAAFCVEPDRGPIHMVAGAGLGRQIRADVVVRAAPATGRPDSFVLRHGPL